MSNDWKDYKAAPIEVFHGEAMKEFHQGAQFESNETLVNGVRFINGIEFNNLLARFKTKIMKEYGISSDAIKIKEQGE